MNRPSLSIVSATLVAVALLAAACEGPRGPEGDPGPAGSPAPTPYIEPDETFHLTLGSAALPASGALSIELRLTDDEGVSRTLEGLSLSWIAAVLRDDPVTGFPAWSSYFTRHVTGEFGETDQPTSDSLGTYEDLGDGRFRYTFSVGIPAGFEASKTHRIAVFARRADPSFADGYEIENAWKDFVPDGSDVTETREIVRTDNCNTCHDPLKAHGEFRREVELCVTCHTPELYDPDTRDPFDPAAENMNPLDMKVMVHRIHQGVELPSMVRAQARGDVGFKYSVIGFGGNEHVYAEVTPDNSDPGTLPQLVGVTYPRDQQNCTTCHTGGADSERHRTTVTREACGSCHDATWFSAAAVPAEMEAHAGGAFETDSTCASCHVAEMGIEFDLSIEGAHVIPTRSEQLPGLEYSIVSAAFIGSSVNVVFSVRNGDGSPVTSLAGFSSFSALVNGPTTDYPIANLHRRDVRSLAAYDAVGETWSVTLPPRAANDPYFPSGAVIPPGSEGTWAVGLEARRSVSVPGYGTVIEGAPNPVAYFALDGGEAEPRRTIVQTETCNVCHDRLTLHGGQRREVEYCVICHNAEATDWARRPKTSGNVNLAATEDGIEERSIDFRVMIHKIHTGKALEASQPYVVYGFGSNPYVFGNVGFPGDRSRCTTCHEDGTYLVEAVPQDALDVLGNETATVMHAANAVHPGSEERIPPITAACIACHDSTGARIHAELNTNAAGEESCVVCHGENREFSVREVHREE